MIEDRNWYSPEREGMERARRHRRSHAGRATVSHPDHGSVVVPAASKLAAIMCAAEIWRADWAAIIKKSKVERCDKK